MFFVNILINDELSKYNNSNRNKTLETKEI